MDKKITKKQLKGSLVVNWTQGRGLTLTETIYCHLDCLCLDEKFENISSETEVIERYKIGIERSIFQGRKKATAIL